MKFDVVIIGGGIIGSAAAYFLARNGGGGDIAVIEPDPTYERATTSQAAGGVRQLFSLRENVAMSQYSIDFYSNFESLVACPGFDQSIDFRHNGYLFVVGAEGALTLERNARQQESLGVRLELLNASALKHKFPSLGIDDIALGCYSPDDGWIDPYSVLQGFRRRAEHDGVTYLRNSVIAIRTSRSSVESVVLDDDREVTASCFLNTAGPWAAEIARMIGVELPVQPMCRVQHFWRCDSEIEPMPLVKDESGMFFRAEGSGFVGGCPSFDIAPGFVPHIDRGFFSDYFEETVWPLIANRCPAFERIKLQRTWAGHYAQNDFDGNMIIGRFSRNHHNIIMACGFSGHGVMHAPAVGRALAELSVHGQFKSLDLSAFDMRRIYDNRPYREQGIV